MSKLERWFGNTPEVPVSQTSEAFENAREEIRSYVLNRLDVSDSTKGKIITILDSLDVSEGLDAIHSMHPKYGEGTEEMKASSWMRQQIKERLFIFAWPEGEGDTLREFMRVMSEEEV